MPDARILVVFYSRSGTTETAARDVAGALRADLGRIRSADAFSGPMGLWRGAMMARRAQAAALAQAGPDPSGYDLVVIGTPIWAGHVAPPVRAWIMANEPRLPDYACLYTYRTLRLGFPEPGEDMARMLGPSPRAVLDLMRAEIGSPRAAEKIATFVRELDWREAR